MPIYSWFTYEHSDFLSFFCDVYQRRIMKSPFSPVPQGFASSLRWRPGSWELSTIEPWEDEVGFQLVMGASQMAWFMSWNIRKSKIWMMTGGTQSVFRGHPIICVDSSTRDGYQRLTSLEKVLVRGIECNLFCHMKNNVCKLDVHFHDVQPGADLIQRYPVHSTAHPVSLSAELSLVVDTLRIVSLYPPLRLMKYNSIPVLMILCPIENQGVLDVLVGHIPMIFHNFSWWTSHSGAIVWFQLVMYPHTMYISMYICESRIIPCISHGYISKFQKISESYPHIYPCILYI